ncbi:DNA-directed DNA polymerase [Tulasnella sp. 427]|nr:DNA-directed DNA polymerase [Tulasnella sp. 427]
MTVRVVEVSFIGRVASNAITSGLGDGKRVRQFGARDTEITERWKAHIFTEKAPVAARTPLPTIQSTAQMSTLPLYWKLSSSATEERLEASVELVNSLEHFQLEHVPEPYLNGATTDESAVEDADPTAKPKTFIDSITSEDVRYALRRLTRGLASPKESSRLGFAVALTELLSRLSVVTANQVITLVLDASEISVNVKGQQLRDLLFARLFGLNCVVQSGLLFKMDPLPTSSIAPSSLRDFQRAVNEYLSLGERKPWFKETAWWSLLGALDALHRSEVPWRSEAVAFSSRAIFKDKGEWFPEKLAAAVRMQQWFPTLDWKDLTSPTFKDGQILSAPSLSKVATILREITTETGDDEEGLKVPKHHRIWRPELHFAWDALISQYSDSHAGPSIGERKSDVRDFFRVVVDAKAAPSEIPQLLTHNFTRLWMQQLSGKDRSLNKVAREAVNDLKLSVEKNPEVGIKVVLALLGNTSGNFDRLGNTKIVEAILGKADEAGMKSYVDHLIDTAYSPDGDGITLDASASLARRKWAVDQLSGIVRSGELPRSDAWISSALQFLLVHGFFLVKKKSEDSEVELLRRAPPGFPDEIHSACRQQLYSCLAFLLRFHLPKATSGTSNTRADAPKVNGIANDGESWLAKSIRVIQILEKDERHAAVLREETTEDVDARKAVRKALKRLHKVPSRLSSGLQLLLQSYTLRSYDPDFKAVELFQELSETSVALVEEEPATSADQKAKAKGIAKDDDDAPPEPIDVVLDSLIGSLESDSSYEREVANVVFDFICQDFKESTVDLLLTQVARRDPTSQDVDDMEGEESDTGSESLEEDTEEEDLESTQEDGSDPENASDVETDQDETVDPELRKRIAEALQMEDVLEDTIAGDLQENGSGGEEESEESDIEMMDDDQMMALDDKLAEIFRSSRAASKKSKNGAQREATVFKTRVVDFIETFVKRNARTNHAIRAVMPLVSLAAASSRDEDHMSKKATKVLKTVYSKTDDLIENLDVNLAMETLKSLHETATKVHGVDVGSVFNPPSRYLVRNLARAGKPDLIEERYLALLNDYIKHKQSKVPIQTLDDFIRSTPACAWRLRGRLVECCKPGESSKVYRQLQAMRLLKDLVTSASAPNSGVKDEIHDLLPSVAAVFSDALLSECSSKDSNMSAAQLREVLQNLSAIVRRTHNKDANDLWTANKTLSNLLARLREEKKSKPLNQAVEGLLKVIGSEGGPNKSKKRKQREPTAVTALPTLEEAGDVPSQPKKKKRRERKE